MTTLTVVARAAERMYLEAALNKLTRRQIKTSFDLTIIAYHQAIFEDRHTDCSQELRNWLQIHDSLATYWGFYGDLDLYWPKYRQNLNTLLSKDVIQIRKTLLDAWLTMREKQDYVADLIEKTRESGGFVITIP